MYLRLAAKDLPETRLRRERRFLWFERGEEIAIKTEYDSGDLVTKVYANGNNYGHIRERHGNDVGKAQKGHIDAILHYTERGWKPID